MKSLIIGPAWIGDMVMAQSLFLCLKQQEPELEIEVLAPAWTQPLLERMPQVSKAINMPVGHGVIGLGSRRKLGKSLRNEGYQQAIVMPNSFKSALVPLFAKIPKRTGWRGEARSWVLNDCRVLDKQKYPLMVQRYIALAYPESAELPKQFPFPTLSVDETSISILKKKFSLNMEKPVLVLCPGAEFGASKKWPEEYYGKVAESAIRNGNQVWVLGSAKDEATAEAILGSLSSPETKSHCISFAGKTVLGEAIDLMSLANKVVSNDSGLMHIAAALRKPLVVVYGSTSSAFTPPLSDNVKTLSLALDCSPCFKRECPLQHLQCLRDLKPDRVIQALEDLEP